MSLTLNAEVSEICACRGGSIDRGSVWRVICAQRVKASLLTFRWSLHVGKHGFVHASGRRAAAYAMLLTPNAGVSEIAACRLASIDRGPARRQFVRGERAREC